MNFLVTREGDWNGHTFRLVKIYRALGLKIWDKRDLDQILKFVKSRLLFHNDQAVPYSHQLISKVAHIDNEADS